MSAALASAASAAILPPEDVTNQSKKGRIMSEFPKGVDRRTVLGGLSALTLGGGSARAAVPALPSAPVGINIIDVGGALALMQQAFDE
jgi:hypothetical protein